MLLKVKLWQELGLHFYRTRLTDNDNDNDEPENGISTGASRHRHWWVMVLISVEVGQRGTTRWKPLTWSTFHLHITTTCHWDGSGSQLVSFYATSWPTKYTGRRAACGVSLLCAVRKSEEDMMIDCAFPQMFTGTVGVEAKHERMNLFTTLTCTHVIMSNCEISFAQLMLFSALIECQRGLAMKKVRSSVRLSVCQTHTLWQNVRKIYPDFYTIRKTI